MMGCRNSAYFTNVRQDLCIRPRHFSMFAMLVEEEQRTKRRGCYLRVPSGLNQWTPESAWLL